MNCTGSSWKCGRAVRRASATASSALASPMSTSRAKAQEGMDRVTCIEAPAWLPEAFKDFHFPFRILFQPVVDDQFSQLFFVLINGHGPWLQVSSQFLSSNLITPLGNCSVQLNLLLPVSLPPGTVPAGVSASRLRGTLLSNARTVPFCSERNFFRHR